MQVDTIGDEFNVDLPPVGRGKQRTRRTRRAMMQRGHGIEQVRRGDGEATIQGLPHTRLCEFEIRIRMPEGTDDTMLRTEIQEGIQIFGFRGDGDGTDPTGTGMDDAFQVMRVPRVDALRVLCTTATGIEIRPLEVETMEQTFLTQWYQRSDLVDQGSGCGRYHAGQQRGGAVATVEERRCPGLLRGTRGEGTTGPTMIMQVDKTRDDGETILIESLDRHRRTCQGGDVAIIKGEVAVKNPISGDDSALEMT